MKNFAFVAVAALALAACGEKTTDVVEVPANEAAAATVELNDDGSVKNEAEATATEATPAQ